MLRILFVLAAACGLFSLTAHAAEMLGLELNTAESADDHCRLTFVIQNKNQQAIETIKLDLVTFNPDGIVQRRMVIDMGPVRADKTTVKTFAVEGGCNQIGSILVNDVTACSPGEPSACLDGLSLSSRVNAVRFYK